MEAARRLLVGVTMAIVLLLVVECAVSLTLSSRLIHRFSEELKSARVSRSGGEASPAWPERRSLEYYRMLVSSDVRRQKMRLGSRYQLLFPSEGSQAMSFGDDLAWLHYTWIDIGTPNVSFLVALDSGSDLLWVPCNCIQCAPLSSSYYDSLDRDLNEYSPSGSITSKHLPCSHHLCILGPNCKSPKQPCPYTAKYDSTDTFSSGFLVEDTMHFAARSDNATNISAGAPVIIGCGRKQSGGYLDGAAPDGVMGLGLGEISVPSLLAKAGLLRNSFSLCFNEDASGRVFFGDQGPSAQQSTPFLPLEGKLVVPYAVGVEACCIGGSCLDKTNFKALVDSGTSFTFLPKKAYEMVVQEFDRQVNATSVEGSDLKYCYKSRSQEMPKIPSLTLKFASNNSFLVHDPTLSYNDSEEVFCLAIQPTDGDLAIIGQNYMTGYRLVFDRENLKLCWSPSNCQDLSDAKTMPLTSPSGSLPNPLPTTEQQSSPNGHGVAPAVAQRTPSKPSAASPQQLSSHIHLVNFLLLLLFLHPYFSGH